MRRAPFFFLISAATLLILATFLFPSRGSAQDRGMGGAGGAGGGQDSRLSNNYWLTLGLAGGTVIPTGNGSSGVPHGSSIQGYILAQIPGFLCLRFNLGYQKFNNTVVPPGAPGYNGTTQEILNGVGGLQMYILPGPVRPYITAGLGAFRFTTNSDTTHNASTVSTVNFGINAGAGIAVRVGRFAAFGEGIIQNVYTNNGGYIKSAKNIAAVPVNFGVSVGII
jgi:hypothetical protein